MSAQLQRTQHILKHTTSADHEYDPDRALAAYRVILPLLPSREESRFGFGHGYTRDEYPNITDEGRIVTLFELLDGSILGDEIFCQLDNDGGIELSERGEDE